MSERSELNQMANTVQPLEALGGSPRPMHRAIKENIAYPCDTTEVLNKLIERYERRNYAIPVSFRSLVPWLKVGERATHYIHSYPAKLLPHIAHFFLSSELLCPNEGIVLDPFGGSGTVALETCLSGRVAAYVDTNPLARLIASAKLWSAEGIDFDHVLDGLFARFKKSRSFKSPSVVNLQKWFEPAIARGLSRLRSAIDYEADPRVNEFLQVTFSATVRRVSNADTRLSVPVLLKSIDRSNQDASFVWKKFCEQYKANVRRIEELRLLLPSKPQLRMGGNDARRITTEKGGSVARETVDLVITSPPYAGAQKYIRASSLSLGWLGLAGEGALKPLENQTIGREHLPKLEVDNCKKTSIDSANRVIERIRRKNPTRAAICATYLNEMEAVLSEIYEVLKIGGHFILVIGNNEVCGEKFLSSDYLSEHLLRMGFDLKIKLVDEIKSRGLMTKRNKTAGVITREWVLVFKKVGKNVEGT